MINRELATHGWDMGPQLLGRTGQPFVQLISGISIGLSRSVGLVRWFVGQVMYPWIDNYELISSTSTSSPMIKPFLTIRQSIESTINHFDQNWSSNISHPRHQVSTTQNQYRNQHANPDPPGATNQSWSNAFDQCNHQQPSRATNRTINQPAEPVNPWDPPIPAA